MAPTEAVGEHPPMAGMKAPRPAATIAWKKRRRVHTGQDATRSGGSGTIPVAMSPTPSLPPSELRSRLEADFRQRVTLLYRSVQITPPYHSVGKAVVRRRGAPPALAE